MYLIKWPVSVCICGNKIIICGNTFKITAREIPSLGQPYIYLRSHLPEYLPYHYRCFGYLPYHIIYLSYLPESISKYLPNLTDILTIYLSIYTPSQLLTYLPYHFRNERSTFACTYLHNDRQIYPTITDISSIHLSSISGLKHTCKTWLSMGCWMNKRLLRCKGSDLSLVMEEGWASIDREVKHFNSQLYGINQNKPGNIKYMKETLT